jgi:hypothetical protein
MRIGNTDYGGTAQPLHKRNNLFKRFAFVVLLFSAQSVLHAQAATGELSITVTDLSGAAVRDAEATVSGTDTGAVVPVLRSNEQGLAQVPLLQPGRYNSHIVASGLKTVDRNAINVSVGSVISLDVALELGESTQVVTVTGDAPLIEDKSETIAQVVSSKQVTDPAA